MAKVQLKASVQNRVAKKLEKVGNHLAKTQELLEAGQPSAALRSLEKVMAFVEEADIILYSEMNPTPW